MGLLALLLSGCIKVDMDMVVSSDDTVSGTLVLAVDRGLVEMGDASAEDLVSDGGQPFSDDLEGVLAEPYDQDGFVGQRYVFDAVPLAAFNDGTTDASGDALRIERDGDVFRVSGTFDTTGGAQVGDEQAIDPSVFLGSADMQVQLTFPGEVLETNGEVDGTTVTWDLDTAGTTELSAVAAAEAAVPIDQLLLYAMLGVVVLGLGLVLVLLLRRDDEDADGAHAQRHEPEPIVAPLSGAEIAARDSAARAAKRANNPDLVPVGAGVPVTWSTPESDAPADRTSTRQRPDGGNPLPPPPPARD